ncbi:hypothetical protein FRACYDRAFT_240602 [Fragilariopsis cylindrus CCMP1102]|uniref:Uncharacterized protein n=1 Tax=Fragilariopsis cylindrus CCMP1102 TaxID=635003 RepID=A0A1E7FCL8_9STRA|nr:hypothetical protein FRACYDRAFT_240602 [Fragilariopsis cylindrus CCMP1102]|eukprot:OEU15907.1 hypothetical protein FRACYDRAFT_240602 [Fragilariopsis cylindrus CCMP1102]
MTDDPETSVASVHGRAKVYAYQWGGSYRLAISGVNHIDWQQARANRRGLTRRVSNIFAGHFVSFMGAYSDSVRFYSISKRLLLNPVWTVDEKKVQEIKDEYETKKEDESNDEPVAVPFLSTSDILSSWFLRQNKDALVGCMVVDMHSYYPDIAPNAAGNYQAEIMYNTSCDVEIPVLIRELLTRPNGILKRVNNDQELPGAKILSGGLSLKNLTSAPGNSIVNDWS